METAKTQKENVTEVKHCNISFKNTKYGKL